MSKLEFFYDYACPYCKKGHEYLLDVLPSDGSLEVEWHPCEAHPRPEEGWGFHSDLIARGMYIAAGQGADIVEYHRRAYRAAVSDKENIESPEVLAGLMAGMLDTDEFVSALENGAHIETLEENNRLAWVDYNLPAVPSFRMGGQLLKAKGGVGVTKEELEQFIKANLGR